MKKTSIFLVLLLLLIPPIFSQTPIAEFDWLKNEGNIPSDFKKVMDNPTDISMITLNYYFSTGNIIYGTAANRYLDDIIDRILVNHPELRNEIRCYLIRSTEVNAFATASGIIGVNIGLLAQASNESEIAFILAHEIAHYAKKHIHQKKEYKKEKINSEVEAYLRYHTYSREIEMEADRYAIEAFFSESNYAYAALGGVFDMLQYSYLPFDEMIFQRAFVEMPFYTFPDNYFLENLNPIRSRDDYVDTLSTHPNVKKRRENVENIIGKYNDKGRSLFLQPESLFKEIREICRFECINVFLTEHEYDNALYNIYFLKTNNPNNEFLDVALATAYYGLCKHKLQSDYSDVMRNHKQIEGEKQQLHYLFSKLTRQELNVLALRNLWDIQKKYPENSLVEEMLNDIALELVTKTKMKYTDFSDFSQHIDPAEIKIEEEPADTTTTTPTNRYQKIRKSTRSKVIPTDKFKTVNYMLVDLKALPEFIEFMDRIEKRKEDEEILKSLDNKSTTKTEIDKIAVLDPFYWRGFKVAENNNADEKIEKNLQRVEKDRKMINNTIEYSLKKLNFDYYFFTKKDIVQFNTEQYNTYTMLQQWQREYVSTGKTEMLLYHCHSSEQLIDEIGYDKVSFIYVSALPYKFATYGKFEKLIFYSALQYTILPMTIFNFLLPNYKTFIAVSTVDLRNGKTINANSVIRTGDMAKSFIDCYIYDSFYNLKKGK